MWPRIAIFIFLKPEGLSPNCLGIFMLFLRPLYYAILNSISLGLQNHGLNLNAQRTIFRPLIGHYWATFSPYSLVNFDF